MQIAKDDSRNLSEHNVVRRLRVGIFFLMLALFLAAFFEHLQLSASSRIWLFIPFFLAGNAFFQAIFKTCGFSALRGLRHTPEGTEKIADSQQRKNTLLRGKQQILLAVVVAAGLTALFIAVG